MGYGQWSASRSSITGHKNISKVQGNLMGSDGTTLVFTYRKRKLQKTAPFVVLFTWVDGFKPS